MVYYSLLGDLYTREFGQYLPEADVGLVAERICIVVDSIVFTNNGGRRYPDLIQFQCLLPKADRQLSLLSVQFYCCRSIAQQRCCEPVRLLLLVRCRQREPSVRVRKRVCQHPVSRVQAYVDIGQRLPVFSVHHLAAYRRLGRSRQRHGTQQQ